MLIRGASVGLAGLLILTNIASSNAGDSSNIRGADGEFDKIIEAYRTSNRSAADKRKLLSDLSVIRAVRSKRIAAIDGHPMGVAPVVPVPKPDAKTPEKVAGLAVGPNLTFFLRQDFADLGSLNGPIDT